MMSRIICINCNEQGHMFKDCPQPIISYGILGFKKNKITNEVNFLLIQRKDTIGYIDFIKGKLPKKLSRELSYKTLVEEMIYKEKMEILSKPFNKLWSNLWSNHKSKLYINEYRSAKNKFYMVDIYNMITNTPTKWIHQEYCIPKGRKNSKESPIDCAIREFTEETGYNLGNIKKLSDFWLEELFLGSNGITYKHLYLLAEIDDAEVPRINKENISQAGEVRQVKWFNFKQSINIFRDYQATKRDVMYKAKNYIDRYFRNNVQSLP